MGIEIKVDLNEGTMADYAETAIKAELVKGAVKLIVEQFSQERMEKFVEHILTKSLERFNDYALQEEVKKIAEPLVQAELRKPEMQARIAAGAKQAVEEAVAGMPEAVKTTIHREVEMAVLRTMRGERR
jgi:uncharacterized membrane protein YheB (UPF0754 family)